MTLPTPTKLGYSFSPGGLLFPYHIGVLTTLERHGYVTDETPIAGSSAGAIAVASHGAKVDPQVALEGCIRISERCLSEGGARGKLLPLLQEEMDAILPPDAHEIINEREGMVGIAYRELFPVLQSVLATEYRSREELIDDICSSSMFPFFTSKWPARWAKPRSRRARPVGGWIVDSRNGGGELMIPENLQEGGIFLPLRPPNDNEEGQRRDKLMVPNEMSQIDEDGSEGGGSTSIADLTTGEQAAAEILSKLPRLVVDGFFTTQRERIGCPILPPGSCDRTIAVSVFPPHVVGLSSVVDLDDLIAPDFSESPDAMEEMTKLLQEATEASTAEEHRDMFDRGMADAERWIAKEERRGRADSLVGMQKDEQRLLDD